MDKQLVKKSTLDVCVLSSCTQNVCGYVIQSRHFFKLTENMHLLQASC